MAAQCCRFLIGLIRGIPSPFVRLLATGYYDGPTEGLIECGTCKTTYSFNKLDWDDQQDVRVFALSPVVCGGLEEFARAPGTLARNGPTGSCQVKYPQHLQRR